MQAKQAGRQAAKHAAASNKITMGNLSSTHLSQAF